MSRLSKAVRRIAFGPIVTLLVRWAEEWLGGGTGTLKKKLVTEVMKVIERVFREAGVKVPENAGELVDELVETNVTLLNAAGEFSAATEPEPPFTRHTKPQKKQKPAARGKEKEEETLSDNDAGELGDVDLVFDEGDLI